jgi:restriction endonuclease S subunit
MNKLSELATLKSGLVCKSTDYIENGLLVLRATDIASDYTISIKEKKFLNPELVKDKYLLKQGDILVTKVGSRIGDSALFLEEVPAVANGNLIVISPTSIESAKLLERIISKKNEIRNLATGAAMQSINISSLSEMML